MAEILAGEDTEKVKVKKLKKRRLDGTMHKHVAEGPERGKMIDELRKSLPDAGYYRDEILKAQGDQLQKRIQEMATKIQAGASVGGLAAKLGIDREIVQHFDPNGGFKITNARGDMVYCWITYDYPTNAKGAAVRRQLTKYGWEVVNSFKCTEACKRGQVATCEHDMPEAPDLRQPDGTRKLGDTILMRCDKILFAYQCARDLAARMAKAEASRAARPGVRLPGRVHTDPGDPLVREKFQEMGGLEETIPEGKVA